MPCIIMSVDNTYPRATVHLPIKPCTNTILHPITHLKETLGYHYHFSPANQTMTIFKCVTDRKNTAKPTGRDTPLQPTSGLNQKI